ncbi:Rha family transcriptional regulator [Paenibacillus sp. Marseille-Q4541]|uniref:Rha family transcriptional regulator n=1 Tax=Paenibacillus sp. Marseille-Q4541 TaxID=2831522 RepID=UPI001BA44DD7|nr:Rha family transcriptional regulator [Paenibacillus sp. Marseille-Q4541]
MDSLLVFIKNGNTVTDSLTIAEKFNKGHKNVVRDIEVQLQKLNEAGEEEWGVLNFERTHYQHPQNDQWYSKFDLTEDAFAIVAMGYVTSEAMKMKVKFLEEFKRMRNQLTNNIPVLDSNAAIAIALRQTADVMDKLPQIESKLETIGRKLETQITLDSGQQRRLQQAVSKKVCSIEPDKDERGNLFRQLYKEIKDRWGVPSYKDVLRQDLQEVISYVNAWRPVRRAG